MTVNPEMLLRLQFLVRVVRKECRHLIATDQRLFASLRTLKQVESLEENSDLAKSPISHRFVILAKARIQSFYMVANTWIPGQAWNDNFLRCRHEYVEDPALLFDALQSGMILCRGLRKSLIT